MEACDIAATKMWIDAITQWGGTILFVGAAAFFCWLFLR